MVNASIMIVLGTKGRSHTRYRNRVTSGPCPWPGYSDWAGEARPDRPGRQDLRAWLARFAGRDDIAFALEGCTGWRYVGEAGRADVAADIANLVAFLVSEEGRWVNGQVIGRMASSVAKPRAMDQGFHGCEAR
jgi:NAD(P)-dependent dehydrogenase (short-subunit alcohol dehydrogenase family)